MTSVATPARHVRDDAAGPSAVTPAAKRARHGARHHPSEYIPGSVMKVKLHNFMTYSDVEMEPGPRLNVILGPNGTGKSSFVCALAIGLAGSTKLLGRADKLSEFVKRGEQSGYSEITLATKDPDRPLVVRREIKRKDSSSTWRVNNVVVTQERVKQEMHKLGVQLDNLCQFLPQDRVVEFARLSPEQLLMETERAIGNAELYDMHKDLIEKKEAIEGLEREVANKRAKIDKLKAENASVERDVTRFNEREALRATAAEMKTKVPWLVFGQAKTRWADAKTELAALKRNIIAEEEKLKHLKTPMVKARDELDRAVAKHKKCAAARKSAVAKQRSLIETMEKEAIDHEAIAVRLQRAKEDSASRSRRIKEREKKLRDAEAARARGPSIPESNDDELKSLRARRVEMNAELRAVEEEHEELCRKIAQPQHTVEHASRRLAVLNSVRGQRLAKAREVSKRQRLAEFDEYVRENANYFVKPVLGPILTLMECADPTHRNMLSQSINNTVFGAYVVQTKADYDKVHGTARAMKCDVYLVDKVTWTEPDVSHLASLGVTHRLDQTFDAPAVIKTALCNVASLHKAYALKPMPGAQVERILKTTEVRRAFTPDTAYAASSSRYDANAQSITVRDLRASNTFQGGVDERERGELEKKVEGAKREVTALSKTKGVIQERRKKLENEVERVAARQKNLTQMAHSVREEIRRLDGAVASARGYLERDSRATDVQKIERETKRDASVSLKKRVKTALELAAVTGEAAEKTHELTTRSLRCKELHVQYEYFKDEWNTASETNNRLRDALRPAEEQLRALKETARDLRVPAMEATNGRDPGKDAALEAKFARWDNDLAILEESIRMIEDEADAIMCPNEAVLEDYKARQRQCETIEAGLVEQERSLGASAAEIDALRAEWTPKLRRLVETINENFKRNFAAIGCAGEVRLREDPGGDRLDLWKLEIWVKFRAATDMHILDAHRQSGGERSVSTMLYLISLQELTRAPFRVVDEINQGMDPVNERKIFKRMTDAASKDSTPQTFLLTPKLLNNLKYTEDCTVLCIFNGPWIAEVAKKWRALQEALQPAPPPDTPP